jgi:hypothetical protein
MFQYLARYLARPDVFAKIQRRAFKTPYYHLYGADGSSYMDRWWFFNPDINEEGDKKYPMIPFSIRLHHIKRRDLDRHDHCHPGDFRTFVLKNWYKERREAGFMAEYGEYREYLRKAGDTATLSEDEYHSVIAVHPEGVWTLFVMWAPRRPKEGSWGFLVNGMYVPWRKYLSRRDRA